MSGEHLHRFDLELCRYALGNIIACLDRPRFPYHVARQLRPSVRDYIKTLTQEDEPEQLLLDDRDFYDLALAVQDEPPDLDRSWVPYQPLHRRSISCVKEIRDALTTEYASKWARRSGEFAERLERDDVRLSDGILVVWEWVADVRRLLRAMGATHLLPYPEGSSPTPTNPTPPTHPGSPPRQLTSRDDKDIERMRRIINATPDGKGIKALSLIKAARINNQRGRKALRWLHEHGEYQGFVRVSSASREQEAPSRES